MPRIEDINQGIGAAGPVDYAAVQPNQAFADLGRNAAGAAAVLTEIADHDAALEGAAALADFRAARAKRQTELRTQAKDLQGFTDVALADFDEAADQLVIAHDNPRVQEFLGQRLNELRSNEEIESDGWAAAAMVQRTELRTVEVMSKLANVMANNPGQYAAVLKDYEAAIDAAGLPAVNAERALVTGRAKLSDAAIDGLIMKSPYEAKKQLGAGTWNDRGIDVASKLRGAEAEINRRKAEARANAAQSRAELSQDARDLATSDLLSRRITGKGIDPEALKTIRAGMTDKEWDRYTSAASKADTIFKVTGDMRSQSLAEIQTTLEKSKPKGGEADFADLQAAHAEAVKIANSILTERNKDPGAAARDAFPNVAQAWQQFADNNNDPGHLRVAIKRTLAAQDAMGIPADKRKPLPGQFATAIAGEIRGAPPDQAAKKLGEFQQLFGSNWGTVFRQLAPSLDANTAAAATLDNKNMAAILLETSRVAGADGKAGSGLPALRKALGVKESGDESLSALIADNEDMRSLRSSLARRGGGGTTGVAVAQAAETLALGLIQRNGISPADAAEQAVGELVTKKYNFGRVNGVPFTAPKAVDIDAAERGASRIMGDLKGDGLDLPGADPGAVTDETRKQYVGAVKRNGYWVTLPGNTGIELWAGDAPVTRYGQRIRSTWDVLTGLDPGGDSGSSYTNTKAGGSAQVK